MKKLFLALGVCLLGSWTAQAQITLSKDVAVVPTESGQVRGYVHGGIYTYKGIPYAEANRFEAPHKPKAWTGVRSSLVYGPVAPLLATCHVLDSWRWIYCGFCRGIEVV